MKHGNQRARSSGHRFDLLTCSLAKFTAAVRQSTATIGCEKHLRFGTRKVFISAVWGALIAAGHDVGALGDFKRRLVLAKGAGLLELARADLVAAMPSDVVLASEISERGETFHFVIDRNACDPWDAASEHRERERQGIRPATRRAGCTSRIGHRAKVAT